MFQGKPAPRIPPILNWLGATHGTVELGGRPSAIRWRFDTHGPGWFDHNVWSSSSAASGTASGLASGSQRPGSPGRDPGRVGVLGSDAADLDDALRQDDCLLDFLDHLRDHILDTREFEAELKLPALDPVTEAGRNGEWLHPDHGR